ncbi:PDR/VanB family oxidoreductase [Marinobacterium rhizophilum]|uniref:Oxidoreductase n=1 Tax=Marinobacterium rhizophilum TaxID=420402 RepID=A0ABY5HL51_9GAMM|nr:PDR/VanB family oxidoreductase [Marinobacterium rhizophilum]UTW13122.1 oxidoreductase [Marinobacterium rhizophilum]
MSNPMNTLDRQELLVRAVKDETPLIRSFELVLDSGAELPPFEAGAHLAIHLGNGLTRQYSLFDAPGTGCSYRVAVLKDAASRGGSMYMHDEVQVGDRIRVTGPGNNFPLAEEAATSVLIGGGIGVTPILSMALELHRQGAEFEMHYCARSAEDAAFVDWLRSEAPFRDRVQMHFDGGDPARGLDVQALLAEVIEGRHLYCCGPGGLMDAVEAASSHWPANAVHFERFKASVVATAENQPFSVYLSRSGLELEVPADKSVLRVLRENGFDINTLCEEGVCGSCLTDVLDGEPEHRDQILSADEKSLNDVMAVCCSRAKSSRLVLDL